MSFSGQRTTAPLRAVARSAKEKVAETEPQAVACAQLRACSRALSSASPAVSAFLGARCRTLAEGSAGAQQQVPSRLEGCESCGAALLPGSTCRRVLSQCLLNRHASSLPPGHSVRVRSVAKPNRRAKGAATRTTNRLLVRCHHCQHTVRSRLLRLPGWSLTSQRVAGVSAGHASQQAGTRHSSRRHAPG